MTRKRTRQQTSISESTETNGQDVTLETPPPPPTTPTTPTAAPSASPAQELITLDHPDDNDLVSYIDGNRDVLEQLDETVNKSQEGSSVSAEDLLSNIIEAAVEAPEPPPSTPTEAVPSTSKQVPWTTPPKLEGLAKTVGKYTDSKGAKRSKSRSNSQHQPPTPNKSARKGEEPLTIYAPLSTTVSALRAYRWEEPRKTETANHTIRHHNFKAPIATTSQQFQRIETLQNSATTQNTAGPQIQNWTQSEERRP
jgi:hypothetical protein